MEVDASLLARAGAYSWAGFAVVRAAAARVWLAGRSISRAAAAIGSVPAAGPASAHAVFKKQSFKRAEKELALTRRIDRYRLVNWTDPEYPQTLLEIYDPPVMLYVRGDAQVLNQPSISIVGTRRPTLYGTQMAERLGRELAARGLVVVSGMARGIDAGATRG